MRKPEDHLKWTSCKPRATLQMDMHLLGALRATVGSIWRVRALPVLQATCMHSIRQAIDHRSVATEMPVPGSGGPPWLRLHAPRRSLWPSELELPRPDESTSSERWRSLSCGSQQILVNGVEGGSASASMAWDGGELHRQAAMDLPARESGQPAPGCPQWWAPPTAAVNSAPSPNLLPCPLLLRCRRAAAGWSTARGDWIPRPGERPASR